MKSTLKYFSAALAIVAAVSCSKEPNIDNALNADGQHVHMTFSASIDPETKTTLTSDKSVYWTDDDAIVVFYEEENYLRISERFNIDPESNDADPKQAVFSGMVASSPRYYGAYPAKGWDRYSGATMDYAWFDGLRTQNAVLNSFDPEKHISLANCTENRMQFKNVCALAKIKIGSANIYTVKIDGTVTSSGNGAYTEGSIGGNLWFKPGEFEVYRAYKNNNHNSIILANTDGTALTQNGIYYIVLPVCTIGNFKVTLCNKAGDELYSISKSSEFKVERNKIYDLGTLTTPNKYSLGKQITKTSDLYGGTNYIILSNSDKSKCWTNSNGSLTLSSPGSTYFDQHVFTMFVTGSTGPSGEKYNSDRGGRWMSIATNKLVTESLQISAELPAQALVWYMGNQWDNETGYDFDFYKNNSSSTLYHSGNSLYWGTTSNSNRKWLVYEAKLIQ